jgi:CXXX repeat modification system protein
MQTKKLIAQVSEEEKREIQTLFERRNGLAELSKILTADNTALYEKIVADMGETQSSFQRWWDDMGARYGWESDPDGNWEINFQTNEIYLTVKK